MTWITFGLLTVLKVASALIRSHPSAPSMVTLATLQALARLPTFVVTLIAFVTIARLPTSPTARNTAYAATALAVFNRVALMAAPQLVSWRLNGSGAQNTAMWSLASVGFGAVFGVAGIVLNAAMFRRLAAELHPVRALSQTAWVALAITELGVSPLLSIASVFAVTFGVPRFSPVVGAVELSLALAVIVAWTRTLRDVAARLAVQTAPDRA